MTSSREADYERAGFAGEIGFGSRPAVIAVDFMRCYFERSSPMFAPVEDALASCLRVIGAARAGGVPVFFTRQVYDAEVGNAVYVRKVPALKLLCANSALAELHPALPLRDGEVFVKRFPSAFHRTGFGDRLRALGIDTLIVTGLTTSGCIRATAMDVLLNDLHGVVVRDAVGDRDASIHEANLFDIAGKLADVKGEAEVIDWLAFGARM